MSMTSSYKTDIVIPKPQLRSLKGNIKGSPCMDIMQKAVSKIARERGGECTQSYRDCNGNEHPCILGLSTPQFKNGIGIQVDGSGRVQFKYDKQGGSETAAKSICDDLARAYSVIALMRAHKAHGYRTSIRDETPQSDGISVLTEAVRS